MAHAGSQPERSDQIPIEQTIILPFPPSVNSLWNPRKGGGWRRSDKYRQWLTEAGWELVRQKPVKIPGRVGVRIHAIKPDKRVRDLDNLAKAVFDLLVTHKIIEDDKNVDAIQMAWQMPSDNLKGVSVTIWSIEYENVASGAEENSKASN